MGRPAPAQSAAPGAAAPGSAVVVRGRPVGNIAKAVDELKERFLSQTGLAAGAIHVAEDDFATLGRFADRARPYDILISLAHEDASGSPAWSTRTWAGRGRPTPYVVGERRVLVFSNRPLARLDFEGIRAMLGATGQPGTGRTVIATSQWVTDYLQARVMTTRQRTDWGWQSRRYPLRDDIQVMSIADAVEQLRGRRATVAFVGYDGTTDLDGLPSVSIAAPNGDRFVRGNSSPVSQQDYPLTQSLTLYLHPSASRFAEQFCEFCTGDEAGRVIAKHGFMSSSAMREYEATQRIAQMDRGKGPRVSTVTLSVDQPALRDLAVAYIRAHALIQPTLVPAQSDVAAVGAFCTGRAGLRELLLLPDRPSARAMEIHGTLWNALGQDEDGQPDGTGPTEHILAGRAVALVVNATNRMRSIPLDQLRAIYRGEVTDWTIVGGTGLQPQAGATGPQLPIRLFGLPAGDPTTTVFENEVLPRNQWGWVSAKDTTADILKAVGMDRQAMGFVSLAAMAKDNQAVRVLGLRLGSGERMRIVDPTPRTTRNASYPLSQRLYLYEHPEAGEEARRFVQFIATCGISASGIHTDTVQGMMAVYRQHDLIPLSDVALAHMDRDAAAARRRDKSSQEQASHHGRATHR